jgi:hypothetical protein
MNTLNSKIRASYTEALYFLDKYLLEEKQLLQKSPEYVGYLVLFEKDSEPYKLASSVMANEIGISVIKNFGYLMYHQDDKDIVIKAIF